MFNKIFGLKCNLYFFNIILYKLLEIIRIANVTSYSEDMKLYIFVK